MAFINNIIESKKCNFLKSGFIQSVGVIAGGTALAQAITVLALPIITRLYTPLDFSILAVYSSLLGIGSVVACLRIDIALPMPEQDGDAVNLLALALCSSALLSLLVGFILWIAGDLIVGLLRMPELKPFLWMLPVGIWLSGSYSALQFWFTRKKSFGVVAKTRIFQAVGGVGAQLGCGWLGIAPFGLLLGQLITSSAGVIGLSRGLLHNERGLFGNLTWERMRHQLSAHRRFPTYSTLEALANSAAMQLPVVVIAAITVNKEAGCLILASKVMAVPMRLVGAAVAQVYLSRAATEQRSGTLSVFTENVVEGLAKAGAGPILFVGVSAPVLFGPLFGSEWQRAGELVLWMTPWFVIQFVSSPISMVMHLLGRQKDMLLLTVAGLIIRMGLVLIVGLVDKSIISETYAVSGFLFYVGCYCVFMRTAGVNISKSLKRFRVSIVYASIWLLAALTVNAIWKIVT